MGGESGIGARLERRRFLACVLAAAAAALQRGGVAPLNPFRAWAAPAAPPPPPGSPPDKSDASGVTVKPTDPAISAGPVEFPGLVSTLQGYIAAPAGGETYPAILLVHDTDGLSEHERDIARRFAKAGYVTLAPDLLSRLGGTAKVGTATQIADAMTRILIPQFIQDGNAAVRYLETHPLVSKSRLGMMAFGLGGAFAWFLLVQNPDLKAASICYGGVPNLQLVPHVTSSVLAIFGDTDGHNADDLKELDAQMKKSGLPWMYKIEPKAGRGFFDDTRRAYVPDAAKDFWKMSLDWYGEHLKV